MDSAAGSSGGASSSSAAGAAGRDAAAKMGSLPERFASVEDVVAKELKDLAHPWDLAAIEERIREYSVFSEKINAQLSSRVMANYNEFVQGMQQVQAVETELTLIGVLVKNGRRKLQERDLGLVRGSMHVTRQHKKSQRLTSLLDTLSEFQGVVRMHARLGECLSSDNYCEAIAQQQALQEAVAAEKFQQFPGLLSLREGLSGHIANVQQKLSDGLRVAAVSAAFDAERYEEILKAYSMMAPDQALSVGKELLRHVTECIVAVSRQCMLMFSADSQHERPGGDWHRKANIRELAGCMEPTQFVDCTARLYEHLCDFLYRHQFLCRWHEYRAKEAESGDGQPGSNDRFREVLRDVLTELNSSKRNVWHHISQQVSLVLMTLEFQYPALSEESFLHILHLTQTLIEEGDNFMADYQPGAAKSAASSSSQWRQWSAPIKNTLKSKAHDYFQSLHHNAWVGFKVAYIEQDSWQRLPVARNYSLIRKDRLQVSLPRRDGSAVANAASSGQQPGAEPRVRTAESNPFRNYQAESLHHPNGVSLEEGSGGLGRGVEASDEVDEHALLQHWIDDNDALPQQQIGSSMLSNSNRSPVVSSSTVELAHLLERYFRMMTALPQLALDVFQSAVQLVEFYVHCVLCLFVQDRHLQAFLQDLEVVSQAPGGSPPTGVSDPKLPSRHEALLLQRLCPELRRAVLRARECMSSLSLPPSCASMLNMQAPVSGHVLLQVAPFSKLTSPGSLCGLSERCVGAESVGALLSNLKELSGWLGDQLPKNDREAVDRFFVQQEAIAQQLQTFVLRCAASDVLEVPHVGRVSLDHFSNTMQALKWDARDFSSGSPGAPYIEQLKGQIDELARRIPCAGGGSIRYATQRTIWGWMEVRIVHECVEVIAKCGRKKSQEALQCLADDFQLIRAAVQQNFRPGAAGEAGDEAGVGSSEEVQLVPADHPMFQTTQWAYLDQFIEAHASLPADIGVWCKRHPEYPLRLHKAVIEYLQGSNPKAQRQIYGEVEAFLTSYIAEVARELSTDRRGL
mmetsp:Transcript_38897/g.103817  ORF Transcript_38897/g.103817 Transcript_38897/m.103817 type:complete len:1025 (-) Transcript_38897:132-3206(-)